MTSITIGANQANQRVTFSPSMANRHGLIAGATGTGKTVTLQILAEAFSRCGVPVFAADVKGDLAGLASAGTPHSKIAERVEKIGIEEFAFESTPVVIWDVLQQHGIPVRTTVTEVGPYLLGTMLECNETQRGVLHVAFKVADDEGLLLLDLKDLRELLVWLSENRETIQARYGNVAPQSVAAIQRRLLVLEEAGGSLFFGEPALKITHLLKCDSNGRGIVNLLDARTLLQNPDLYAAFLLWLLSELFEELPEVGDTDLPKLVFFFDEAHLLFRNNDKTLLEKIEQVVRLIRSKGVGVFFVTQHPQDIPDSVLSQLGNRFQHALRAFTPGEQRAVKIAAQSFRVNPQLDTGAVITELGVGEALVSVLDTEGVPTMVERALIVPPQSRIGTLSASEHKAIYENHLLNDLYQEAIDRKSAYELILERREKLALAVPKSEPHKPRSNRQSPFEAFVKSVLRSAGNQIGRQIFRGLLGSVKR